MNEELRRLYQEDQAERQANWSGQSLEFFMAVRERDRARRTRADELIAAGALLDAADYFHAAMLFQHGDDLADYWRAHELAKQSADLGNRTARNLAAAAYDRWLVRQGQPQKYGTQYRVDAERRRVILLPVDPATTDAERRAWEVPPLAWSEQRAEEKTRETFGEAGERGE